MKLIVKSMLFLHDLEATVSGLFEIPQMQEVFDEGFEISDEMKPGDIAICPGYWPAADILNKLPDSSSDTYLILTSDELKGDYGRIHGRGHPHKAIVSNSAFLLGKDNDKFDPTCTGFHDIALHEIGHALGLEHHEPNGFPCVMPMQEYNDWNSLRDISFCSECYKRICD